MPTKEPVSLDNLRVSLPAPRGVTELDVIERLRVLIRSVAERRAREANEPIDATDEVQVSFLDDRVLSKVDASVHSSLIGLFTSDVALVERRVAEVRSVHEVLNVSDERLLEVTAHESLEALLDALMKELKQERLDARWLEAQERVLDLLMKRCGAVNHDAVLERIVEENDLDVDVHGITRDAAWSVHGGVAAQVAWRAVAIDFVMRRATVRIGRTYPTSRKRSSRAAIVGA